MKRKSILVLSVLLLSLLIWGGYQSWQQIRSLKNQVGSLGTRVVGLEEDLSTAEIRAEKADGLAQKATDRADQADQVAAFMEERAETAESDAAISADVAAAERMRAAKAAGEASQAIAAQELAEQQRMAAERKAEDSEIDAWRARRKAEALEKQRNRDLDRLETALGRLAETRRTALGVVMNLGDSIEFDFNESVLRPKARELLSRVAGVLLTATDFGIQVYGHTDDIGSKEYNLELSDRRANAVRDYLIEAGINPDLVVKKGFGMEAPLVSGTDEASRQRNRRVEIAVVQITETEVVDVEVDDGASR